MKIELVNNNLSYLKTLLYRVKPALINLHREILFSYQVFRVGGQAGSREKKR